jgi:hypothetical protein
MTLEQELVRAEAENLVAEAQLTNITRQKLKEAFNQQINAVIERSEKHDILAKHSRRLLELLDDTPVVPGAEKPAYDNERAAKDILLDAEEELAKWQPSQDADIQTSRLESNLLPSVENQSYSSNQALGGNHALGGNQNGSSVPQSISGEGDERGRKVSSNNEESAFTYDPKVLEGTS